MSLKQKRIFWFLIWITLILSGPVTVLINTDLSLAFSNILLLVNLFQRLTGAVAFTLLFIQITLGAFMYKWVQILGAKAYRTHVVEGLYAYAFVLIHPFMQAYINYYSGGLLGGLMILLPDRSPYINFGKIGFLLLSVGVAAGYFRTKTFFRRNWKTLHILNYVAFFSVAYHSLYLGTDVNTFPFSLTHKAAILSVTVYVVYKLYGLLTNKLATGFSGE